MHAQAAHDAALAAERENAAAALAETAQLRRALDDAQAKLRQATAQAKADAAAAASTAMVPAQGGGGAGASGAGNGDGNGKLGVWNQHRDAVSAVSKLFEHVGLTTVFGLLKYDDRDVRLHAVKVRGLARPARPLRSLPAAGCARAGTHAVNGLGPTASHRCMRDVKEVHTTVCRHYPSTFLCEEGRGVVEVRTRSEFSQYQTYQTYISVSPVSVYICGGTQHR